MNSFFDDIIVDFDIRNDIFFVYLSEDYPIMCKISTRLNILYKVTIEFEKYQIYLHQPTFSKVYYRRSSQRTIINFKNLGQN